MAEIAVPDYDELIVSGPSLYAPAQINRSKWTGRRKVIGLPGTEVWRAKCAVDTIATELEERPWRAFLFALRGPANWFRLNLPCNSHIGPKPVVAAGATNGYTLPLSGMAVSSTILRAGQFMTVPLPSGRFRAVTLTADLVSNGSGVGTATFEPALTEVPTLAATIETTAPFIPVARVDSEIGFSHQGGVAGIGFDVEEAL